MGSITFGRESEHNTERKLDKKHSKDNQRLFSLCNNYCYIYIYYYYYYIIK